ncbi:tetratricopeptide repeat protein [Streptomyces iranensis]|uniref:Tetratricopeptide (TPR) repeat protein n=1 Tax=Streptomyces iranensis TaxID=576784 RepID=A0A060ZWM7_9ACTN|nr:tetratricopeptide repeat protein [Streptomyces iranensis]MBP2062230.1 tetratricopeptide (TPR) repeat protein [Streptomyces iranensis]CDR07579.1 Tetratricopeptide TPR_2 repeat-containingprotein [Streptomyces iranensis]
MAAAQRPTIRELIRQRRRFVGRRQEMAAFRENFTVPPEDAAHHFLFHVRGDAGVGKTTLLRQLENTAREHRALTASVDESVHSVPEVMAAISAQFAQAGHPLKSFDKLLATYRQRRHEADAAAQQPAAPQPPPEGAAGGPQPSASSAFAVRAGLAGLGMVPGVGAFAGVAEPDRIAQAADRARAKLSARLRSHDDVDLVISPLDALTPAFLKDVGEVAASVPWMVWFFDTYERTGPLLDLWLRDVMFEGRYGSLPANAVVTLAGQGMLAPRCWADYADLVVDLPLVPFTEAEARQLLTAKGVDDEQVIEVVLRLTGGLPVLVSMLAEARPTTPEAVGDPSGTAVERFLKWVSDETHRSVALAAALPRRLDEDVFAAAVGDERAELYGWLRSLPFVGDGSGRCRYHQVVRTAMLRLQRKQSPQAWRARHLRLADAFARWQRQIEETLEGDEKWEHERWLDYRLEEAYHRLCATPEETLREELRAYVCAYIDHASASWEHRWRQMLVEAGRDSGSGSVAAWGDRLLAESTRSDLVDNATRLLDEVGSDERAVAMALGLRGMVRADMNELEGALADAERALELDADCVRALAARGSVHLDRELYEQALESFDRAVALDPDFPWPLARRGETYRLLGRYEESLTDLNRSFDLHESAWTVGTRAQVHHAMEDYEKALADFGRAVEITPEWSWIYAERARTYRFLGRDEEALADCERALELGADYAAFGRVHALRNLDRYEEAIDAADRYLASHPEDQGVLAERGEAYRMTDRFQEALADFGRAIEIEPSYVFALVRRGQTHEHIGLLGEALADFDAAASASPDDAWVLANRGALRLRLGDDEAALADLDRALGLGPDGLLALESRARCHLLAGRYAEAATDIERAAALDDHDLDVAFAHAMLVSHTAGLDGARERWTAFEALLEEHGDQWDPQAGVAAPIISRSALGDGAGAERLMAELTATRPYWQIVDDVIRALDDLALCPGADPALLAALRAPLAELRAGLAPGGPDGGSR